MTNDIDKVNSMDTTPRVDPTAGAPLVELSGAASDAGLGELESRERLDGFISFVNVSALLECIYRGENSSVIKSTESSACALGADNTITCKDASGRTTQTVTPNPAMGTFVEIGVSEHWVAAIDEMHELWFHVGDDWARAQGEYVQLARNYSLDIFGRIHRWDLSDSALSPSLVHDGAFRYIAAFTEGVCALDSEGEIRCFISEAAGPLPAMFAVPPRGPFRQLSVGPVGACAMGVNPSTLYCWTGQDRVAEWGGLVGLSLSVVDVVGGTICASGADVCWSAELGQRPMKKCPQ